MPASPKALRLIAAVLVLCAAAGALAAPAISAPARAKDRDPSAERERVRAQQAELASQVDAMTASDADVRAALADLEANVAGQEALLAEARRAAEEATAAHEQAVRQLAAQQSAVERLRDSVRELAVEVFIRPPAEDALAALDHDDPTEAAQRRALIDLRNQADLDVLDQLVAAQQDLEVMRAKAAEAEEVAAGRQVAAQARLDELRRARDQQAAFAADVQARLDRALAEAAALADLDATLSAEIQARQEELLRQARVAELLAAAAERQRLEARAAAVAPSRPAAAARPGTPGPDQARAVGGERRGAEGAGGAEGVGGAGGAGGAEGTGGARAGGAGSGGARAGGAGGVDGARTGGALGRAGLASVPCPNGGSITVAASIADELAALIRAAAADGVILCGGGWRDSQRQAELRLINGCPDVHTAPASACRVPTARPGNSMHERGLAVDFTCNGGRAISTRASPCFRWLDAHAAGYGLHNLPSEPWHWSTNGQ